MKTQKEIEDVRTRLFAKADWINKRCNEIGSGDEKTKLLKTWEEINGQINLISHIIYNSELTTLS